MLVNFKRPKYKFRKKLNHNEAVCIIEKALMLIQTEKEGFDYFQGNRRSRVVDLCGDETEKIIKEIAKQEDSIDYACHFLEKDCFILGRYFQKLPHSEAVQRLLDKITNKNKLTFIDIEFTGQEGAK